MVGSLFLGKVQALEERIDDLEFGQDKIIHLLSAQSTDIAVNREHIKHLGAVLHEIQKMLTTNHATLKLEAGTFYIHHLVSQLRVLMDKYCAIIQAASVQRLATQAISAAGAIEALSSLKAMAKTKGLEPVINSISHFHQLPCSYVVTEFGLRLYIHVPIMESSRNLLELHRYLALPIALTVTISGVVHTEKPLLALGRDESGKKVFKEFSELDLTLCHSLNSVRICPHSSQILNREPYESCLFNLYYSQHQKALKSCRILLQPPKDTAIALSKNRFVTFSSKPQTYNLICRANQTRKEGLQLLGTQTLDIPEGCSAHLPFFILNPQSNYYFTQELATRKWTLPPSDMWSKDLSEEELNKVYESIKAEIGLPSIKPMDISMIKALKSPFHYYHPPSLISLSVCAFVFIVVLILIICICKAYKRETRNNPLIVPSCPTPQQAVNPNVEMYPLMK